MVRPHELGGWAGANKERGQFFCNFVLVFYGRPLCMLIVYNVASRRQGVDFYPKYQKLLLVLYSDVARQLNYKTKTTYFFQETKTLLKTIKLLTQELKNVPVQSRPVLPNHAGNMSVTEKNLLITCFLVKFCFV